jgi:hypothetical protein
VRGGRKARVRLAGAFALALVAGCGLRVAPAGPRATGFRFAADTFAFPNVTVWEYDRPGADGEVVWRKRLPPPDFALRCGSMVRTARQFYANVRFDPSAPPASDEVYAQLFRRVLDSDPRQPVPEPIVIPGYGDLRSFSAAREALVKSMLDRPWRTYVQRGNWRMIFPFTARQQERVVEEMRASLARGWPPIVHVLRYPKLIVNHLMLAYDAEETPSEIRFHIYDPNDAAGPVTLTWDRGARAFALQATPYFPGGYVKAYTVYDGLVF